MYMYTIVIHLHTQKQAPPPLASPELKWKNTCRRTEKQRNKETERENGETEKQRKRKKEGKKSGTRNRKQKQHN